MNAVERVLAVVAPGLALKRAQSRHLLAMYEGAERSRLRKLHREVNSINDLVRKSGPTLRAQARYLERNHDISRGALGTLVNNVVGPKGIGIEPQPRRLDGSIHTEYAAALREAFNDWEKCPEVTKRFQWSRAQRLMARRWIADGEVFAQEVIGPVPTLNHGTLVPYSIEMLEADMVPMDYNQNLPEGGTVRQGIERNTWGEIKGFWVYKVQPDEYMYSATPNLVKRIPAERMLHLFNIDRIHQLRGVSQFASVITRIEDIKDYEESERVAAKIAAMLTAYIKKGEASQYPIDPDQNNAPRQLNLQAGTIIDSLTVGEEIGMIDSNRPNPNLVTFRQGQLRAVAAGLGASYSSISRDYNGTYSAQRQELVEQWVNYAVLCDDFVGDIVQPVWERFVMVAHLSGVVPMPKDVKVNTQDDCLFIAQQMPWIDPLKEVKGAVAAIEGGLSSHPAEIRKRGDSPDDVIHQESDFLKRATDLGLDLGTGKQKTGGV
jgi:lambda family phage portal protein